MSVEKAQSVTIKPITKDNWKEAIALEVNDNQKSYIASNIHSIAESSFYESAYNYGIYDNDQMVGFILIYKPPEEPEIGHIVRFMIDKNHQRKGLGKKGIIEIIDTLVSDQRKKFVTLSVIPENEGARAFYTDVGFVNTKEIIEGELKYRYTLTS